MSETTTNKIIRDIYTESKKSSLDFNANLIKEFINRVAPNISELTPIVRKKFPIKKDQSELSDVLYDIPKTVEILSDFDDNLRLVVRVLKDYTVYALEKVVSTTNTSQKLIFVDMPPNEDCPTGAIDLVWFDELFMFYALGLCSYVSDALNGFYFTQLMSPDPDGLTQLFVDLFDKKNLEWVVIQN